MEDLQEIAANPIRRRRMRLVARGAVLAIVGVGSVFALATSGADGAFPGDNGMIAFTSNRDGNADVHVMAPDGSDQRNLTRNPAPDGGAAWSPDGRRIAFVSERDGANNSEIYVMDADGSRQTRLTTAARGDTHPTWSPDGRRIAFVSDRDDFNSEVYVMKADGSGQVNLTRNPASDDEPAWSPDGRRIAFSSDRADEDAVPGDIYTMDADGSNERRLTMGSSGSAPAWAPDVERIAFMATSGSGGSEISVMARDGSGRKNLTRTTTTATGGEEGEPAWSPDGRKIAFTDIASSEIYAMAGDGSRVTRLTTNAVTDEEPDWGPDPGSSTAHDSTPPVLRSASLRPRVFAADRSRSSKARAGASPSSRRGTTVRYRLSEGARVAFRFERRTVGRRAGGTCRRKTPKNRLRRPCSRYRAAGSFSRMSRAGKNRKHFSGRIGKRRLRPGRYRVTLRARDAAGNRSRRRRLAFRMVPG